MGILSRLSSVAVVLVVMAAAGCGSLVYTSSSYETVRLSVFDAETGEPVSTAKVSARTVNLFSPSYPNPIVFESSRPDSSSGVVDGQGEVRLRVVEDYPVQLVVVAPGYEPWEYVLEDVPAADADRVQRDTDRGRIPTEGLARLRVVVDDG
jgi:hypothetical protein